MSIDEGRRRSIANGLPPLAAQWRTQAETVACRDERCRVPVGETCHTPDGRPLVHMAAHLPRMLDAGVQFAPTSEQEIAAPPLPIKTPEQVEAREAAGRAEADRYRREVLAKQAKARRDAVPMDEEIPLPDGPTDEDEPEGEVVWLRGPRSARARSDR
jgi:hypothetical protein